ncbi:MAG: class I SAM-dependent methyltransferase [Myxococcota bacterium]|nr:class I SAM-dependent methyltransferase [Myxococcota bacterium]
MLTPLGLKEWWYHQLHKWVPVTKYAPYGRGPGPHTTPRSTVPPGGGNGREAPIPAKSLGRPGLDEQEYLDSGEEQIRLMIGELEKAGYSFRDGMRVLEFGCSSGRMTRWLHLLPVEQKEVYGCDIFADAVRWASLNLNPDYRFFTNTTMPHLPFADGSVDLVYAGSVFSHIYELADAWLLEIHRMLSEQGVAYLTIREKYEIELFEGKRSHTMIAKWLREDPASREAAHSDFSAMELGGFRNPNVFYDLDDFTRRVQPHLEVRGVVREAFFGQTAVILGRARRS